MARYIIVVVALATAISLLAQQISSITKPPPTESISVTRLISSQSQATQLQSTQPFSGSSTSPRNSHLPSISTLQLTYPFEMADGGHVEEPKNFAPKTPVNLNPPKDDPITYEELSKCDGMFYELVRRDNPQSSCHYRIRLVEAYPGGHKRHRLRRIRQRCIWTNRTISRSVQALDITNLQAPADTTNSFRRQRSLPRPRNLLTEARRLRPGMERSGRQVSDRVGRVVYFLQQAV